MKPIYPLIPKLHYTGERTLLLWHTHNRQNQVIVASSINNAIDLWKIALEKNGEEATAKEMWQVKIVLPSEKVCEEYSRQRYENELMNFKISTADKLKRYIEKTDKAISGIELCDNYDPSDERNDNPTADEYDKEYHDYCKGCYMRVKLLNTTWKDLFEAQYDMKAQKVEVGFKGEVANENEQLYICRLDNWHSRGIMIEDINQDTSFSSNDRFLFFFHGQQIEMPAEVKQLRDEVVAKKKEQEKVRKEQWDMERKDQQDKEFVEIEKMFELFESVGKKDKER